MRKFLLIGAACFGFANCASAAFFDSPVPTNAYIVFDGHEWAWGSPCSGNPDGSCDPTAASYLAYQGSQGWRLPTAAEIASGPAGTDFLFAGANVPYQGTDPVSGASNGYLDTGGSALACATPYFSGAYRHCDYGDQLATGDGVYPGGNGASETWFIRDVNVPEPGILSLLGLSSASLAVARRRRAA